MSGVATDVVGTEARTGDDPFRAAYQVGAIACGAALALIAGAVAAFFVWPIGYDDPPRVVLERLQETPLEGVMALDPGVLLGWLAMLPIAVAVGVALREETPTRALAGGVLVVVAISAIISTRPILELLAIAQVHAEAASAAGRALHEGAAAALLARFEGTAWVTSTILLTGGSLLHAWAMLSSDRFARATALLGIWTGLLGLLFVVPVIGPAASLGATVLGLPWLALLGRDLWRLGHAHDTSHLGGQRRHRT